MKLLNPRHLIRLKKHWNFFKNNRDKSFVIWRPHPLLRQTLVSMLPNLVNKYDEIMSEFINGNYGVLDTNESMYYAIFWSDMCYGCKTSSLTELYKYTGKMVLEDDPKLTKFVSKRSTENLLNELKESNVVSEPDYSLRILLTLSLAMMN